MMRRQFVTTHQAIENVWPRLKVETRLRADWIKIDRADPSGPELALVMFNRTQDRVEVGQIVAAEEQFLKGLRDESNPPPP